MRERPLKLPRADHGFTLLELLIAVSLLGLIFAALTGGLRFGTTAWQKASIRLSQSEDMRLTYQTLRRQISTSVTLLQETTQGQETISFEGRRDRLRFVGPAPARAMAPGLYRLTLSLEPDAGSQALTLRWQTLTTGALVTDAAKDNMEPVLRRVRSIALSYFGQIGNGLQPKWVSEWREAGRAPRLVRISIETVGDAVGDTAGGSAGDSRSRWPDMIIPIVSVANER